jgi:hypothetical protein
VRKGRKGGEEPSKIPTEEEEEKKRIIQCSWFSKFAVRPGSFVLVFLSPSCTKTVSEMAPPRLCKECWMKKQENRNLFGKKPRREKKENGK